MQKLTPPRARALLTPNWGVKLILLTQNKGIPTCPRRMQMIMRKKIGKALDTKARTLGFNILKFGSQNRIPKVTEFGGMQKMSIRINKIIMYVTLGTGYVYSVINLILDKE